MSLAVSSTTGASAASFVGSSFEANGTGDIFSDIKDAIQSMLEKLGLGDGPAPTPQDGRTLVESENAVTPIRWA